MAGEFDLIDRIRARIVARDDVVLGIGDDAALLQPPAGMQLVVAMDTLNAGIHFPHDTVPADIGWKALAVNLSDLAAMGATPAWCTLSLSLPEPDVAWVDAFLDGFDALARQHAVALVGGDTTRGPLSVCVTVFGFVSPDRALRRDGSRVGDDVWVSGTPGDAAAALAQWSSGRARDPALRARLDRPTPRVALGLRLSGFANAAIDISDGLLADLAHVCRASAVCAEIDIDALPVSDALRAAASEPDTRRTLQASGGDDYELCFTAPVSRRAAIAAAALDAGVSVSRIGRLVEGQGVVATAGGALWAPVRAGWDHFAG
ncbi:thiamine-phosphate kinase [Luteimonas fraxinea]|uniref:Thiamine-monophosphate kinase n=1 Tax=Luteimonas fraxinea TaxID=2901869 RepID=A0ABS8UB88_9GAMM|nr:thiamine-phosphate kinase [Luteimonas fraxinea]MCD9095770.1 thiamine-phosphate kinase [Luteimonas fraxinea]MCD9124349.1 thiamine-phosphate kinase [Luteimonas fraxinea]UHH11044.1 thiamine-phosphate kinase [Luteimonas fraxinea]